MKKLLSLVLTVLLIVGMLPLTTIAINVDGESPDEEYTEYTEGYYTYKVTDGKATITGCDKTISGNISIPSTLGGYNVTSIGNNAFSDCVSLTSVTIPDSVTNIDGWAFHSCSSLTSVEIPNSVTNIGEHAFQNCYDLTSLEIPNGITTINSYAFHTCRSLTEITIPDSVTIIGYHSFYACGSLVSVKLSNKLTSIDKSAFRRCYDLASIVIPKSVTSIGGNAFYDCSNLKTVYNLSELDIVKGKTTNGYVAYYADYVISDDGDSDGDNKFTSADILLLQQHMLGISLLVVSPDLNDDGVTDAADLALIQMKTIGY